MPFLLSIGGDILDAGGAYAAFSIASGVLIYALGKWEDRVKHQEKLVILGYLMSSVGMLGSLLS